ncbi:MAG: type IV pilus biogenesis/stability protein PilW [Pseudomonadales bacterium]|nr:type IV pilus biogenesis/stability protein PilW [Pseudomonadales bacterium]
MVKAVGLGLVLMLGLTACVTETNNPLAQNRDPAKAAQAYVEAGTIYLQKRRMDDASRTLKRAYEIAPDDPAVNNALALFYAMEGEAEQVIKYFERALAADPGFSQARNNYAAYLFKQGDYEEAIKQLQRVVKDYRYGRRFTAYENLGICYLRTGDREAAASAFNRALQLNPNLPVSLLEMAEISLENGDNQMAARYLSKYEAIAQPSPRQLWLGIRLQRILGNKDKLASYELALKNLFPGSDEYKAYKATL